MIKFGKNLSWRSFDDTGNTNSEKELWRKQFDPGLLTVSVELVMRD